MADRRGWRRMARIAGRYTDQPRTGTRRVCEAVGSCGANWNGPIGTFRLVVDKGSTENLVSFCMNGVTKIGPTRFEVVKTDFEPTRDLDIVIVKFASYED